MAPAKASRSRSGSAPAASKASSAADAGLARVRHFTRDEDLSAYRSMLLIRRFEEKAGQLYGMGHIGGFCHLYIGQEATGVGAWCPPDNPRQ